MSDVLGSMFSALHPRRRQCADSFFSRVKELQEEAYTQKEAEAAVGLRTDNGQRRVAVEKTADTEIDMTT